MLERPKGATLKAIRLHELEGPDELVYEDVPEPEAGPGETVVRLRAAALNRRDLFATQGQYPGVTPDILPRIPAPMVPVRSWLAGRAPRVPMRVLRS